MRKKSRSFFSLMLTLAMLITMPMQALAQEQSGFVDMPNNWSTEALTRAVDNGLLSGYNGKLHPDKNLTRAEMAAVINRAFGAKENSDISGYTDVKGTDWFYGEMAKAVGMGTFQGYANKLRPNDSITREEVFSVLSNALKLRAEKANKVFMDSSEVSAWAQESINGMINGGYISGSNGKLNPKANITRAEFAQVMHNIIKDYVNTAKVNDKVNVGNVIVNTPNATLKNVTVKGDLIIADGVGEGEVTLDNVKVEGRMLVRAGGENSIIIKGDSEIDTIIIVKNGNKVRIFNETGKEIAVVTVDGEADVILEGKFKNVVVQSPDITVYAQNTQIENIEINGTRSKVIIDEKSELEKVVVRAANVVIGGKGTVEEVEVKAGGSGTEITTPQTQINVDKGANNVIGTGGVEIESNETYVNGKTDSQDAKPLVQSSTGGSSGGTVTTYTVNYSVVGSNGTLNGTVTSGNSVNSGTSVTFTATPSTGYEVKEWKVNGVVVESGNILTRTVSANTTVTVEFKLIPEPEKHSVIYYVLGENGTISSSINSGVGVLPYTELTFTATANTGYEVKEWKVNDVVVEAENTLTTTITAYTMVSVEFQKMTHNLTYEIIGSNGAISGTHPNNSNILHDTIVVFTAAPDSGYRVKSWSNNGIPVITSNTVYMFNITEDTHITVEFEEIPLTMHTVTYSVNGTGGTLMSAVPSGFSVPEGFSVTFIATPSMGYRVKAWYLNGELLPSQDTIYTLLNTDSNVNIIVEFEIFNPNLTYDVIGGNGIIIGVPPSNSTPLVGMPVSLTALPDVGYKVKSWIHNGVTVVNDLNVYSFVITDDTHVTVEFEPISLEPIYSFNINGSNTLSLYSDQPIYFYDGPMLEEVSREILMSDLLGIESREFINEAFDFSKIFIEISDTSFQIIMENDVFDRTIFEEMDIDENGVERIYMELNLGMLTNSLGMQTLEPTVIPIFLKLSLPFENGTPVYSEPLQASWELFDENIEETDPVRDTTPPEFVGVTPSAGDYWVGNDESVEIVITVSDDNIYRMSPFPDIWYYALPDVYNGNEIQRADELDSGVIVTYEGNGTWRINLGEDVSAYSPGMYLIIDAEDYAGNRLSDTMVGEGIEHIINFLRLNYTNLNYWTNYAEGLDPLNYTNDSWNAFWDEYTYVRDNMPETTQEEIDNKALAIEDATLLLAEFVEVAQVDIADMDTNIRVGVRYNLTTTVLPVDATNKNIIWSIVSGPGQIDQTGELIANEEGIIVVRATSESYFMVWDELVFTAMQK